MQYLKAYGRQVRVFFRLMYIQLFRRDRDLDAGLVEFTPKPGFFWQFLEVHGWVVRSFFQMLKVIAQLLICYVAAAAILAMLLLSPVVIFFAFFFFSYHRYRKIRQMGQAL